MLRRIGRAVKRFWKLADGAGLTGNAAMLAYNMLIGVIPVALLSLFVAGQVLSSEKVETSVLGDLREVFPGTTEHTLNQLLGQIKSSTATTGVLALIASLWLAGSFWGALDTSFSRIYGCPSRRWLEQKRFGFAMVFVVLLFMVATVTVPTAQSFINAGTRALPFDLARVAGFVYVLSLLISAMLLFGCLTIIYARVPNRPVPWRAVWPGALSAAIAVPLVSVRVSRLSDAHLDHCPVRHDDRVRADRARLVLPAGGDHPRRRRHQRAAPPIRCRCGGGDRRRA